MKLTETYSPYSTTEILGNEQKKQQKPKFLKLMNTNYYFDSCRSKFI